ncbi:putative HTH-type transcriptional regulator [Candidatus Methanoperedenaceae archaeon GB50]|nr:putative HTH-type transcriptional regulator [Candidatus Methanoperedenaceae archaeon GB50]
MDDDRLKELLEVVEHSPKIPPEELAEMLGVSVSEVTQSLDELEEKGVIRNYKAVIDWDALGEEYVYAIIELKVALEDRSGYDAIAKRIAGFPEVRSVHLVSGDHDLSITVRGRSMKSVAFFVAEKIAPLKEIRGTVTHFVLKAYKEDGIILFDDERPKRLSITP